MIVTTSNKNLIPIVKWMLGLILSGTLTWATYITTTLHEDRSSIQSLIDRLARIETKIDILMEKGNR